MSTSAIVQKPSEVTSLDNVLTTVLKTQPSRMNINGLSKPEIKDIISILKSELLRRKVEDPNPKKKDYTKYAYFPIQYPELEEYRLRLRNQFWTSDEIDYHNDRADWDTLDENTKRFVKFNLFFFAPADGILLEHLGQNMKVKTSKCKEAGHFYTTQEENEQVHNRTYALLIETLIRDPVEKAKGFDSINNYPAIKKLTDWMFKWMEESNSLMEQIVAFSCVEGIFFSSAFASIYWIKKRNILAGLCKANEFIARDEALHTEFAVALYHHYTGVTKEYPRLEQKRINAIISSAVDAVEIFTRDALRVDLIGMNANDMVKYVKCTANRLLESYGYDKIYDITNPFDWMAVIALPNKTNFFESKPSEYSRQSTSNFEFNLDLDF